MNLSIIVKNANSQTDMATLLKQIIAEVEGGNKSSDKSTPEGKYRYRIYSDATDLERF